MSDQKHDPQATLELAAGATLAMMMARNEPRVDLAKRLAAFASDLMARAVARVDPARCRRAWVLLAACHAGMLEEGGRPDDAQRAMDSYMGSPHWPPAGKATGRDLERELDLLDELRREHSESENP